MSAKTFTLDLTDGPDKKAYLAKIIGSHPVYKLQREFCEIEKKDGRHRYFRFSENGVYEYVEYSAKGNKSQQFFKIEDGTLTYIKQEEVMATFNAPEKGQSPTRRRSNCACTDGCCDNGCHCGSECNCKGGPIWNC